MVKKPHNLILFYHPLDTYIMPLLREKRRPQTASGASSLELCSSAPSAFNALAIWRRLPVLSWDYMRKIIWSQAAGTTTGIWAAELMSQCACTILKAGYLLQLLMRQWVSADDSSVRWWTKPVNHASRYHRHQKSLPSPPRPHWINRKDSTLKERREENNKKDMDD